MNNREIKTIGLVVKPKHNEAWKTAAELLNWCKQRNIDAICSPQIDAERASAAQFDIPAVSRDEFRERVDLIVVLGGDGTMISAARLVGKGSSPILGINYGSLGYITEFRIEELYQSLESVFSGEYSVNSRVMIVGEHWRGDEMLAKGRVLNDVVITKSAVARIIEIDAFLNDLFLSSFRSDGLIVSTPTGSTAYNLSAGGPIVFPSMNALVVTPICPFTLSNRPIVIPDDSIVELRLKTDDEGAVLSLDGQIGYDLQADDRVLIRKSAAVFNLIQPPNRNYFDVLRDKLRWGR